MSRELSDLVPEFRPVVENLLATCQQDGYVMRPFFTQRTPSEQGKLWRQSRSTAQVRARLADLRGQGADFLAECIESVGPQNGPHVTNAIPGFSWHQWGEAVDCFWLLDGQAEWSTRRQVNGVNGYVNYATQARTLGLTAGGFWSSFQDWPHVQLREASNPGKAFSLQQIDRAMRERFGG
jgi:hypothetical protein